MKITFDLSKSNNINDMSFLKVYYNYLYLIYIYIINNENFNYIFYYIKIDILK